MKTTDRTTTRETPTLWTNENRGAWCGGGAFANSDFSMWLLPRRPSCFTLNLSFVEDFPVLPLLSSNFKSLLSSFGSTKIGLCSEASLICNEQLLRTQQLMNVCKWAEVSYYFHLMSLTSVMADCTSSSSSLWLPPLTSLWQTDPWELFICSRTLLGAVPWVFKSSLSSSWSTKVGLWSEASLACNKQCYGLNNWLCISAELSYQLHLMNLTSVTVDCTSSSSFLLLALVTSLEQTGPGELICRRILLGAVPWDPKLFEIGCCWGCRVLILIPVPPTGVLPLLTHFVLSVSSSKLSALVVKFIAE